MLQVHCQGRGMWHVYEKYAEKFRSSADTRGMVGVVAVVDRIRDTAAQVDAATLTALVPAQESKWMYDSMVNRKDDLTILFIWVEP